VSSPEGPYTGTPKAPSPARSISKGSTTINRDAPVIRSRRAWGAGRPRVPTDQRGQTGRERARADRSRLPRPPIAHSERVSWKA
jgi:hypothetical protein